MANRRCQWMTRLLKSVGVVALVVAVPMSAEEPGTRSFVPLDNFWKFTRVPEDGNPARVVSLPIEWETHEGVDFNGVGRYKMTLPALTLQPAKRFFVECEGVATEAKVYWNGRQIGSHLGAWTPFRCEATAAFRATAEKSEHVLEIVVDEKVGHNTQGFLPVFLPHFGGIWRPVRLVVVGSSFIDDRSMLVVGDVDRKVVHVEVAIDRGNNNDVDFELQTQVTLTVKPRGSVHGSVVIVPKDGRLRFDIPIEQPALWAANNPATYSVAMQLVDRTKGQPTVLDRVETKAAFRKFETVGKEFRLNGKPISIRGVLNWGYNPPRLCPDYSDNDFRAELRVLKNYGFNLMKFCLWVPSPRLLELCDEAGILAWIEYPTWHPKFEPKFRKPLLAEYDEFFNLDRNHPCVVLRSLTCETGPSADLSVVRSLYDLAKQKCPGAVVEDDSSWIGWNRIHDFYDDHPYGNNHTWVESIRKLKEHIAAKGDKPLALGEAIAADTWTKTTLWDRPPQIRRVEDVEPKSVPAGTFEAISDAAAGKWLADWQSNRPKVRGLLSIDNDRLQADSKRYALLTRKFQIEAFRREAPSAAYVVSVIRDFPMASMGLIDYRNVIKWPTEDWAWHGENMLLLDTEKDRRSFASGETAEFRLIAARGTQVKSLHDEKRTFQSVSEPKCIELTAADELREGLAPNSWPVWVVPPFEPRLIRVIAGRHSSLDDNKANELLGGAPRFDPKENWRIAVASRLDSELLSFIEFGGKALLLPDGKANSFPQRSHWFLRGGPVVCEHPLTKLIGRQLLVDLQQFDLAGDVIPDIGYLDAITPIVMLWDRHDIKEVKTHGLVFECTIGKGRLLVSALNHTGSTNAAGKWAFQQLVMYLNSNLYEPKAMTPETLEHLKAKLAEEKIDLTPKSWQFRPDAKEEGLKAGWGKPSVPDPAAWKPIHVGRHWESQGYPNLDGWAWYRIQVDIPASWKGRPIYLSLEGADDYYEVFADGKLCGTGGKRETKTTAFDERKSHAIEAAVQPGKTSTIAIRVFDWYGAGGLHRPVWIGTAPISTGPEWLR